MSNFVDDSSELQAITPKPAAAPAPKQAPATTAQTTTQDANDDFDPSSVSTVLPRLKVTEGNVVRFALIGPVESGFRHYHEASRSYIRCLSERDPQQPTTIIKQGVCCELLGSDAKWARSVLVVSYTGIDNVTGKITSPGWRIASIVVPGPGWQQLKNAVPEGSKVTALDFKMATRANGMGYDYFLQSLEAAYLKNPETAAKVHAAAQPFVQHLGAKIGKSLSPIQVKALVGAARSVNESLDDLETV